MFQHKQIKAWKPVTYELGYIRDYIRVDARITADYILEVLCRADGFCKLGPNKYEIYYVMNDTSISHQWNINNFDKFIHNVIIDIRYISKTTCKRCKLTYIRAIFITDQKEYQPNIIIGIYP